MNRRIIAAVLLIFVAAAAVSAYFYADKVYLPQKRLDTAEKEQSEIFKRVRPEIILPFEASESQENAQSTPAESEITQNEVQRNSDEPTDILSAAEEVNSAVIGWIYIPDTNIDYPIVQGEDNDFYLHNGFDGQYNYSIGCPFLDYRCDKDFSGLNSIVYAHNMEGRAMFADIALFKEENFMQSHSYGCLALPDGVYSVHFFAYLSVHSTAAAYHTVFLTKQERLEYIDYIYQTANYSQDIDIDENSHLLLLSTCTFEYDDARGILVGVIE